MSTMKNKKKKEIGMKVDPSLPVETIDSVPFSLLTKLFSDLRNARSFKRPRTGYQTRGQNESRYYVLTRNWLLLCKHVKSSGDKLELRGSDDGHIIPALFLTPSDAFKIVSLLVPELDTTHAYLGMKESKLADAFVKALDLPPGSEDTQWLKHYKERAYRPRKWKQDAGVVDGDLATVLEAVLTGRCPTKSTMTIGIVWAVLDSLGQSTKIRNRRITKMGYGGGPNNNSNTGDEDGFVDSKIRLKGGVTGKEDENKYNALVTLVQHGTAKEVAEVARIILKDLNMRLSRDNFLNWFHPAAKQHYTQIHDVMRMLTDCHNPNFEIGDAAVQLGQYASVMLTMRPTRKNLPTICEKLRGGLNNENNENKDFSKEQQQEKPYFIMEPKIDGERLQLHKWEEIKNVDGGKKDGDDKDKESKDMKDSDDVKDIQVRTFSRRGHDSSGMYANALFEVVTKGVRARDVILDGEIVLWDDLLDTWVRFENMREVTTAIAKDEVPDGSSYTLKFMVFDVLFVQQHGRRHNGSTTVAGNMVMRLPLYKRRELLEILIPKAVEVKCGRGAKAVIEVVQMERGYDESELTGTLQRYETLGYEGVVAKHPDKPYVLAERSMDIAIKLKPDYFDGGIQDVDVLILGAKYSTSGGRRAQRAGKLSSFLIGVRAGDVGGGVISDGNDEEDVLRREGKWIPVGSVGTGYSDIVLKEIQERLNSDWKDLDVKNLPDHFENRKYSSTIFNGVAKWIQPWKSVVMTIRAFELNRKFYLLRFPRVERVRFDKEYNEVTSMSHLMDLDEHKMPAFIRGDENDDDDVGGAWDEDDGKRRRRKGKDVDIEEEEAIKLAKEEGLEIRGGQKGGRTVIDGAIGVNVSKIEVIRDILNGVTFTVVAADQESKARMEILIHQLGGKFVQNVTKDVDFVVVCDEYSVKESDKVKRVKEAVENGTENQCSVIMAGWVEACENEGKRVKVGGGWVVAANKGLQKEIYRECDRFGDWWMKDTDMDGFQKALDKINAKKYKRGRGYSGDDDGDDGEIQGILEQCEKECGLVFRGVIMYVGEEVKINGCVTLVKAFGGIVVTEMVDGVTHSLVSSIDEDKNSSGNVKNVDAHWVRQCVDLEQLF